MVTLDNAIWLTGASSTAADGSIVLNDGPNSTTVVGTFSAGIWDASQSGYNVSEFGAFGVTSDATINYTFSETVEDLSFDFNHISDDGASTYDDLWTVYVYDHNGVLIPSADVIAAFSGLTDEIVYANPDGSVSIEAQGTGSADVNFSLSGYQISELELVLSPGPGGTQSGGTGISDLTFSIPAPDKDGDGVQDGIDLDSDNDGILDTDEGYSETIPSTITITFDGDTWSNDENTWELYAPDGTLIASDTTLSSSVEITDIPISQLGEYSFVVTDSYGDGLTGGSDPGSYQVAVDGVIVVDSGANPNFGNGVTETFNVAPIVIARDTDGDGVFDYLDLDSDGDGITDNVEAQSTAGYTAPSGFDSDNDGLDDAYEGTGDQGLVLTDTDNDGIFDFIDLDSDNDGIADVDEAGHGVSQTAIDASDDADRDGIADVVDDVIGWDVNDADVNGSGEYALSDSDGDVGADGSNARAGINDLDFRDSVTADGVVEGTSGNDLINGTYLDDPDGDRVDSDDAILPGDTGNDDLIYGYDGDDTVYAGDGNDEIYGGADNDVLWGDDGEDTIDGGTGNDTIVAGSGNDSIIGGDGADVIMSGNGDDIVYAGDGDDVIAASIGSDETYGGAGNDSLVAGGFAGAGDAMSGDTGNDTLVSGLGDDSIVGGIGDDSIRVNVGGGTDTVLGGEDVDGGDADTLDFDGSAGVDVQLTGDEAGTYSFPTSTGDGSFAEIEIFDLTDQSDTLDGTGSTTDMTVIAGAGDDLITGGAGNDVINGDDILINGGLEGSVGNGGVSNQTLDGWQNDAGTVEVWGSGAQGFQSPDGSNMIELDAGVTADNLYQDIQTEAGENYTVSVEAIQRINGSTDAIEVYFNGVLVDTFIPSSNSTWETFTTTVTGTGGLDRLEFREPVAESNSLGPLINTIAMEVAGDDTIDGGVGDDLIKSGGGDDLLQLTGAFGNDTIIGGETSETSGDTLDFSGLATGVTVSLTGDEAGTATNGSDTLSFSEIESMILTDRNDRVDGSADSAGLTIDAGDGYDTIMGGSGADSVLGGGGRDKFFLSAGNDTIDGGSGGPDVDNIELSSAGVGVTVTWTASEDGTITYDGNTTTFTDIEYIENWEDDVTSGTDDVYDASASTGGILVQDHLGGADTVTGSNFADDLNFYISNPSTDNFDGTVIDAGGGNDYVFVEVGSVTIDGGDGDDNITFLAGDADDIGVISGGSGNDTIWGWDTAMQVSGGTGDDDITGSDKNDTIIVEDSFGNDTIDAGGTGGTDTDILDMSAVTGPVTVVFSDEEDGTITDGADTITFSEVEQLTLTDQNDSVDATLVWDGLVGDQPGIIVDAQGGDDTVTGGRGGDTVDGGAGNDFIAGGYGDDILSGGSDEDLLTGGNGNDTLIGGDGNDSLDGGIQGDSLIGGAGNDTITFSEGDTVEGGSGDDLFVLADFGETTNDVVTIDGGTETGGDTLQLGDLADLSTLVTVDDGTGSFSGSVTLDDGTLLTFSEIENIICFTPGTQIATPNGARDIASLQVGDLVVTRDHGLQPIRWIQSRTVPALENFAPIRIKPGVVTGLERDLLVSPQHRMLFQGYRAELLFGESEVLVSARYLVDGRDVTEESGGMVTYIHMMFDEHEVVYAEGAATESFHPGDVGLSAVTDAAREELFALFPDLRSAPNAYGRTARRCLKKHETSLLVR